MVVYKGEKAKAQEECVVWSGLSARASDYRVLLCDIWGVIHNGVSVYREAILALTRFRALGGAVVLISNAPRPSAVIERQLELLGVSRDAFDVILTSGDLTRAAISEGSYGAHCYHLGPDRDLGLFDEARIDCVAIDAADFILCTGFKDDERQGVEDYRVLLEKAVARELVLVCANPDRVVERDGKLIACAGQLADFYEQCGGKAVYFGKPYDPIYQRARVLFKNFVGDVLPHQVLAIGDGLETDIKGAVEQGFASLFIIAGIASDIETNNKTITEACRQAGVMPDAWMKCLVWE